ncbi:MAG: hypothetical protein PHH04_03585 [Thomasclavelia sp.]|nr:hypothetical protein [Thomasclavelia sp.]
MKKKAYVKNQIRNIFKTKARFFSIFIIVCLGAGCFAGLRSSPSIMRKSADSYLNEYGYNDIQYIGTLAFNDSNIKDIESIKGVKEVDYGNRFDATVSYKKKNISGEPTAVVFTSDFKTNVNKPNIQSGRIPKTDDECLLDHHYAMMHDLNIGDNINVKSSYGKKTFKVVGLSDDVRYYVKFDRGTSSIGDGSCALFVLIKNTGNESLALPSSLYDLKSDKILYNNVRVVLDNPSNYNIFSKEYEKYVASINKKIKKKLKNSYSNDYSTLTNQANEKIDEATSKYQKGYDDYNNGLNQYNEGINTYNTNLKLYQDGLKKYQEGYNTYTKNEAIYNSSLTKYQEGLTAYNNSLTSYNQLLEALSFIDNYTSSYQTAKTNLPSLEAAYNLNPSPTLLNQINQLKQLINSYETIENQLINQAGSISNARVLASTTKTSLDDAKKTLEENSSKLSLAKEQLDKASLTLSSTKKTLEDSSVQLANARTTLNSTKEQLANAKSSLDDANTQIQEAKSEIKDIPKGKIISLTSKQDSSIISFDMNADSIDSLSILFPTIFFLVAALVSMTTMTRMVEEYRLQSGTLRSLGYSKKDVISADVK